MGWVSEMAKRDNHYEAALEAYLRWLAIPYVAVDETRRALTGDASLKNLDFLVSPPALSLAPPPQTRRWLTDVKGRRFPTAGRQYWRNWCTREELSSLAAWEELLAPQASGLLVFAFNVIGELAPLPAEELFVFRGSLYAFVGVRLDHYVSFARPLSARWDTVAVPTATFRSLARPLRELCGAELPQRVGVA
jgi:hypothetical protein